jgi:hypothetical protein
VQDATGEYQYLVEACDPCEANQYAYSISGIAVSDFITPHYYDPVATSGTRYSFGGNIERPRQLLPGGYISFIDTQASEVEQILFLGSKPVLKKLGSVKGSGLSLRAWVDGKTTKDSRKAKKPNRQLQSWCKAHRKHAGAAALYRAKQYGF